MRRSDDAPPAREDTGIRYLPRDDVIRASAGVDAVEVVREALLLHAEGRTTLPEEAYLGWDSPAGAPARSIALPGALWGDRPALGLKLINGCLANPARGLPRAQGLTMVFDEETAHPVAILEAAYLSALRTSAYTALSVALLGPPALRTVAVIGCGVLGDAHVRMLAPKLTQVTFALYDREPHRRDARLSALTADGIACRSANCAEEAVRGADVVVTATTTTTGYIHHDWLAPGALIAHVSLDDVLPDVVERADLVVVDDWALVSGDSRRLLGRLHRAGRLLGPAGTHAGPVPPGSRRVDATLADVLAGRHPGRRGARETVLSNPFGMGVLDVALAAAVLRHAVELDLGTVLRR